MAKIEVAGITFDLSASYRLSAQPSDKKFFNVVACVDDTVYYNNVKCAFDESSPYMVKAYDNFTLALCADINAGNVSITNVSDDFKTFTIISNRNPDLAMPMRSDCADVDIKALFKLHKELKAAKAEIEKLRSNLYHSHKYLEGYEWSDEQLEQCGIVIEPNNH